MRFKPPQATGQAKMTTCKRTVKVGFFFAWYDAWIGLYWDRSNRVLYVGLLPMCIVRIETRVKEKV